MSDKINQRILLRVEILKNTQRFTKGMMDRKPALPAFLNIFHQLIIIITKQTTETIPPNVVAPAPKTLYMSLKLYKLFIRILLYPPLSSAAVSNSHCYYNGNINNSNNKCNYSNHFFSFTIPGSPRNTLCPVRDLPSRSPSRVLCRN